MTETKYRVGDEVTIHAKIHEANPPDGPQRVWIGGHVTWVRSDQIATHTPRAIGVGDWVRTPGGNLWQVRFVEDGAAFLRRPGRNHGWDFLSNLTPCDAPT